MPGKASIDMKTRTVGPWLIFAWLLGTPPAYSQTPEPKIPPPEPTASPPAPGASVAPVTPAAAGIAPATNVEPAPAPPCDPSSCPPEDDDKPLCRCGRTTGNCSVESACQQAPPRPRAFRILDKYWIIAKVFDWTISPWKETSMGAGAEFVPGPLVSEKAVWLGFHASQEWNLRSRSERTAFGATLGYSLASLSAGALARDDPDRRHMLWGARWRASFLIPIELSAEEDDAACCEERCASGKTLPALRTCTCDRTVWALVIRPYFQLDYLSEARKKDELQPAFGVNLALAVGL
jgi:hypothetical protein